jgi:hypothetical protein
MPAVCDLSPRMNQPADGSAVTLCKTLLPRRAATLRPPRPAPGPCSPRPVATCPASERALSPCSPAPLRCGLTHHTQRVPAARTRAARAAAGTCGGRRWGAVGADQGVVGGPLLVGGEARVPPMVPAAILIIIISSSSSSGISPPPPPPPPLPPSAAAAITAAT